MATNRVNHTTHAASEPAFTKKDLEEIWKESYQFNKSTLRLSRKKAREWADRSVDVVKDTEPNSNGR